MSLMSKYKSKYKKFWEENPDFDNMYVVDIHVWRQPGMGNSLQTITGNTVSVLTALSSLFETLMRETDITEKDLLQAVMLSSENVRE